MEEDIKVYTVGTLEIEKFRSLETSIFLLWRRQSI